MSNSNKARDKRRDISKAIRESQRSRMDALEAFAQGLTDLKAMRTEVKRLEARVDGELRANAKAAGNSVADIRNVERIVNELADKEEALPNVRVGRAGHGKRRRRGKPSLDGGRVMAGRKAPRPLPRPVRWLAMFLALVFVVSLACRQPRVLEGDRRRVRRVIVDSRPNPPKRKKTAKTGGYGGLKAGGIPTPGDWSRQRSSPSSRNSRETSERCP